MNPTASVLIVDDEPDLLENIGLALEGENYHILTAGNGVEALQILQSRTVDLILADGIAVGDPFYGRQALEAVRASGGDFVTVSDEQLAEAIALLATSAGMLAEPAGVASLAGALADRERAARADGPVLALISGTGLKDHRWLPTEGGRAVDVAPDLATLSRQL